MTLDQRTIESISDLGRRFSDATILMHEAIARKAGLTGTDHKYLGILIEEGPMTAGELAKRTGLTTGAVTGLVDRFEKRKFVERVLDKEDRRKVVIVPNTAYALELLGDVFADLRHKMVGLISTLTREEADIVERYLLATIDVMQDFTLDLQQKTP